MKRISAFGGIQIFNIFINLVRGKFVAMFLGPEGMGINSMFVSSTGALQQLGGLGLNLAFVKEVSAARGDEKALPLVIRVATSLIILTALLGGLLTALLSPWLSQWSFGSYDYTLSFVALGIFVALSIAGTGYMALLQGLAEVKRLSKASLVGSVTGLAVGVPLYYFFGYRGIVPAMIVLSVSVFLFYYTGFRRSVELGRVSFPREVRIPLVRKMLSVGFILMIGTLIGTAVNYGINAFVRMYGNLDDVGFFQAANSLTNQYMGIVFSALSMDYFPRLAAAAKRRSAMCVVVNRQTELVMLIATPLVLAVMFAAPWIVRLLLTSEFLGIVPLLRWLALGILVQAFQFPVGYLFLAHENRRAYFWMEAIETNVMWLVCSVVCYWWLGLIGLGVSLVVRGCLDVMIVYIVSSRAYGFRYRPYTLAIVALNLGLGLSGFLLAMLTEAPFSWPVAIPLVLSALFTFSRLHRLR